MWDSSIFHMTLKGSLSRKVWNVKRDFPPKKPRLTRDVAEFLLSMLNKIVIKCIRMMIFIVDILEIRSIYDLFICFHLFSRTEKVCSSSIRKKRSKLNTKFAKEIIRDVIFWHVREILRNKMKSLFAFELVCRLPKRHRFPHVTNVYSKGNCIPSRKMFHHSTSNSLEQLVSERQRLDVGFEYL